MYLLHGLVNIKAYINSELAQPQRVTTWDNYSPFYKRFEAKILY